MFSGKTIHNLLITILIYVFCVGFLMAQNQENPYIKAEKNYNAAQEFIQMGRVDKAKELVAEALKLSPDSLKIHRLHQSIFAYKDIIDYYQKQYESNKDKPLWAYLYFRLLAREDVEKGCAGIRETQSKFPDFVYLELAVSTCDVANLNWSAGEITLSNLIKRPDAPVEAFENMLRLYALSEKKNMMLPVCKEGLARFPQEAGLYRLCVGYSEDVVPEQDKKVFMDNALKIFEKSNQLADIMFTYGRSLKDEKTKFEYLENLWVKYPTNRVSSNIFSMLWAQYSKVDKTKMQGIAEAALQKDRVGDSFMYTTAVNYLTDTWKNDETKYKSLMAGLTLSDLNWQGVLILAEKLVDTRILAKETFAILLELMNVIKEKKDISKDYLFRNYSNLARCSQLLGDDKKALLYYETSKNWLESSFTDTDWLGYSALLSKMKKKKELLVAAANCYVYSLNKECLVYRDKYFKKEEFIQKVRELRNKLYPETLSFNWKTFDSKEISSANLSTYSLFFVLYADSDNCTKLLEDNKEKMKGIPKEFSAYILMLAESAEQAQEYHKKLNTTLLSAFAQEASQTFLIKGIPSIIVLDKKGTIVFKKYVDMDKGFDSENIWKMILAE